MAALPTESLADDRRCWRCILLNRNCDRMPVCRTCLELGNDGLSILPCRRGSVMKGIDKAFENCTELSDGTWLFCTGERYWKITVDYAKLGRELAVEHAIVDFPWLLTTIEPKVLSAEVFLDQFQEVTQRWDLEYEAFTESIIGQAAEHQWDRFKYEADELKKKLEKSESEGMDSQFDPPIRYDSPIFTALRCLVISHSIATFAWELPLQWHIHDDFECEEEKFRSAEFRPDEPAGSRALIPHIFVQRMAKDFVPEKMNTKEAKHTLPSLLQETVENTRLRLLQADPLNWPETFYVLCLLLLVHYKLDVCSGFTDTLLTAQHILKDAIEGLCQLFLHCCGDFQPLHEEEMDMDWFRLIVGNTEKAKTWDSVFEYYSWFNEIWITNRNPDETIRTVRDFVKHLDNFIFGR